MSYLNLHLLFTLAAANPNRDDAGSPKTLGYGGATRSRISSQAMTRPKRRTFEADYLGDATYRSTLMAAQISTLAAKMIDEAGQSITAEQADKLRATAAKAITSLTAKDRSAPAGRKNTRKAAATEANAAADRMGRARQPSRNPTGPRPPSCGWPNGRSTTRPPNSSPTSPAAPASPWTRRTSSPADRPTH
jgi:hypothetical protein